MGRRLAIESSFENRVRSVRLERDLTQTELAARCGLTRQAVVAIEAGRYVPNTTVALGLARALDCRVEDLFQLAEPTRGDVLPVDRSEAREGDRIAVAHLRGRWVARRLDVGFDLPHGFASADAIAVREAGRLSARLLVPRAQLDGTALLLGCDPGLGLLAAHVARANPKARLAWSAVASTPALRALRRGEAHVAGSHLRGNGAAAANVSQARSALGRAGGCMVGFARWEEGFAVARGNPKSIASAPDLARRNVRLVNRDAGSGSRATLDRLLAAAGVPTDRVRGYDSVVRSHLAAASVVACDGADAAVTLRAAAAAFDLDFVPLTETRFDLVVPEDQLAHPAVATMLDVLQGRALRAELRSLPGYDVAPLGETTARFAAPRESSSAP